MSRNYRFGRFELNPALRQLLADGEQVTLGARAFDVLIALVERRDRMVSKHELLQVGWPGLVVEENNLDVQISALRKALGSEAIETVRGRGYRFALSLESDPSLMPEHWTRPTVSTWPDAKSIAVLPFINMSEDKGAAYFADGVQDDLLTQLAMLGDLKVVSRTSVAEYRESKKNVRQIASELGVASLVEGSVRRDGDRVRISAQLIDARSDKHLWAKSYDRELKDIFAIQSELATDIAKALHVLLSPADEKRLAHRPTENLAAYELYQRYQNFDRRALWLNAAGQLDERIELLTRAVELDPKFALAWAVLGTVHARKYFYQVDQTEARLEKARQAVDRALALAPDDLAVKAAVGIFYYYGLRDYARSAAYLEDLLRVAPNNVGILTQLSWIKGRLGRWPEVNALLERAIAIDPRNMDALTSLRANLELFRHLDEAIVLQHKLAEIEPDNIDVQAMLRNMERKSSGSSAAYEAWRKSLPPNIVKDSITIWHQDLERALELRDLDTAVRMLEMPPTGQSWYVGWLAKEWRALLLLSKGERERAHELSRSSLREADAVLKQRPEDVRSLQKALVSHAILGERQAALDAYKRWRARAIVRPDASDIMVLSEFKVGLYVALGERDGARRALEFLLKRQSFPVHWDLPQELYLLSLRGDPRIEALLKNPVNNGPLPIVNWDVEKLLAEL